jgi:hypothetical protein
MNMFEEISSKKDSGTKNHGGWCDGSERRRSSS